MMATPSSAVKYRRYDILFICYNIVCTLLYDLNDVIERGGEVSATNRLLPFHPSNGLYTIVTLRRRYTIHVKSYRDNNIIIVEVRRLFFSRVRPSSFSCTYMNTVHNTNT